MNDLPPLNALRVFDVVGRLESITDAAAQLYVTPAAVSRQIRLLEAHLETRLFHRQHRRIVLTRAGQERSEEHTSELQSLMRISYAVFCLQKKTTNTTNNQSNS